MWCSCLSKQCFHPSVWFAVLTLVCLEFSMRGGSAPICVYGQAGCHLPSLANLFDRVLQQSSRMHGISSDLHSEFVSFFFSFSQTLIIHHHPSHVERPFSHCQSPFKLGILTMCVRFRRSSISFPART